ncbi:amidohydrolase family protein [Pikeienuella sp. HZG-20]|uniref:amidohydrolase family protein n=1 Tax=Paludibacillus litoralis TaxID=3133267 RepID=UPI0030ED1EA2
MNEKIAQAGHAATCRCWGCDVVRTSAFDIHAHYYPDAYLDLIEREGERFGAVFKRTEAGPIVKIPPLHAGPIAAKFIDLDLRIQAMDDQGVHAQALSLTQPMAYWADDALSEKLCVTFNDSLADAHAKHPDRLYGLATLPMQKPDLAIKEARRIAAMPGMKGVYLGTCILDRELSDEAFWPVYEVFSELRLPVFLHPLNVIGMEDRLKDYFFSNLLGNPMDNAIAAAYLVFGGVLDRFPDLDIVLPHGGGAFPFLIGRLEHGWRVRPECKHLERNPREYLSRFHYDTITHDASALRYLIDVVGADRVLLGSDYCFDMGYEQPRRMLAENQMISDADKQAILETNARRLLKI